MVSVKENNRPILSTGTSRAWLKGRRTAQCSTLSDGSARPWAKGFSMVELLVAMALLALVSVTLLRTTVMVININTRNALRDTASRLAAQKLNEFSSTAFTSLDGFNGTTGPVSRTVKNARVNYTVTNTVEKVGSADIRRITVNLKWNWQNETPQPQMTVSTIRRKQ